MQHYGTADDFAPLVQTQWYNRISADQENEKEEKANLLEAYQTNIFAFLRFQGQNLRRERLVMP